MAGTWIEVDLGAVVGNYEQVVKHLHPNARCMAVVKADAYGLGAVEVARALEKAGCEAFAVTTVEEGLILREHGIQGIILVLGPSSRDEWPRAVAAELQLTLSEITAVNTLNTLCSELHRDVCIHIKLETGMGRTGFRLQECDALAAALTAAPHVRVTGMYTHFARAAQRDRQYTKTQFQRFMKLVTDLEERGIKSDWKHVCNSAAFLDYPEWHFDFVRIGTLLIGHYPGQGFSTTLTLHDPWVAKSRIVHLRKVPKGTAVGYQSIYRTKAETQLAVLPVGYADGFGVAPHFVPQGWLDFFKIVTKNLLALFGVFLGQERVVLNGRSVRVAGKVGMQLTVVDVGLMDCTLGDEVQIPLRRTLANPRIPREYYQDGQMLSKRVLEEGILPQHPEYSLMKEI